MIEIILDVLFEDILDLKIDFLQLQKVMVTFTLSRRMHPLNHLPYLSLSLVSKWETWIDYFHYIIANNRLRVINQVLFFKWRISSLVPLIFCLFVRRAFLSQSISSKSMSIFVHWKLSFIKSNFHIFIEHMHIFCLNICNAFGVKWILKSFSFFWRMESFAKHIHEMWNLIQIELKKRRFEKSKSTTQSQHYPSKGEKQNIFFHFTAKIYI
jgi:hypothetical protein